MNRASFFVGALLLAVPALAQPFSIAGRLSGGTVAVDDVRDFDVEVADGAGVVVAEFSVADVAIVGGGFAFLIPADFDASLGAAAADGPLAVAITFVDDDGATATATSTLGAVAVAAFATETPFAPRGGTADAVGTLGGGDVVSAGVLGNNVIETVPIAFANLTGVPANVADGVDNGNVDVIGAGLVLAGGVLDVAAGSVTAANVVDGTIGSAQIADGAVDGNVLGGVSGSDFANDSLTAADFAPAGIGAVDVAGTLNNVFQTPFGCDTAVPFFVTTAVSSTCTKRTGCAAGQTRNCDSGVCETGSTTVCSRTKLGAALFAP
jgi:hypothetical protein